MGAVTERDARDQSRTAGLLANSRRYLWWKGVYLMESFGIWLIMVLLYAVIAGIALWMRGPTQHEETTKRGMKA